MHATTYDTFFFLLQIVCPVDRKVAYKHMYLPSCHIVWWYLNLLFNENKNNSRTCTTYCISVHFREFFILNVSHNLCMIRCNNQIFLFFWLENSRLKYIYFPLFCFVFFFSWFFLFINFKLNWQINKVFKRYVEIHFAGKTIK